MNKVRDGYKMTEIGEIPEEWECSKLQDYIEIRSGNSPSGFKLKEKGKYPFFKVDDMNYTNKYMKVAKVYFDECKYELMSKGMVVFPKRGASIFTNKVAILDRSGYFDTNTMGLACSSKLNNEYLFYLLKFIGLEKFADTTAVPQINNKHINPLVIPIPTIKEQEKIASILSTVDEQIDNVDALIEKNKELKKGLMQTLLTKGIGHTKFKKTEIGEIPEAWDLKTFKDISKVSQGLQIAIEERYKEFKKGRLPYITIQYINDKLNSDNEYFIENFSESVVCKEDDILMTRTGNTGIVVTNEIGVFHNNFFRVDFRRDLLDKDFLVCFLNTNFIQNLIIRYAGTTTIPDLKHGDFYKLPIVIPPLDEQKEIALILSEVDRKIEEHKKKKQMLEELKKGLMQQLLTGRIRVI